MKEPDDPLSTHRLPDNHTVGSFSGDLATVTLRPAEVEPAAEEPGPIDSALVMGEELGSGGMGKVLVADQRSLAREVAVKRPRTPVRSQWAHLVREALVTGALAHPNIVPIYDLRRDVDGSPLLVMKRVEGRPWSSFLGSGGVPLEGARDAFGWHAKILLQVCHAVAFAHDRGILHRDLKPQNVMIGSFGEVYVVDWGLAVALPGCALADLPRADTPNGVAGTPAYLAPEQARAEPLDARTDVWLLGAVLFELVYDHPVHRVTDTGSGSSSVRALVAAAAAGAPPREPAPTPELDEVLTRALATSPDARYPSVEAFREALDWAVERRSARSLLREAAEHLAALRRATVATEVSARVSAGRAAAHRVLATWPGDAEATAIWREVTDRAVDWHLANREPSAAELLLQDDPTAPQALRERVAQAHAEQVERNRRLQHAEDLTTGLRTRGFVLLIAGLTWLAVPGCAGLWLPITRASWLASTVGFLVLGVGFAIWARDSLSKSAINQQTMGLLVLVPIMQLVAQLGSWLAGMSGEDAAAASLLVFVGMVSSALITQGREYVPSVVAYSAAYGFASAWPAYTSGYLAAANVVFLITLYRTSGRGWVSMARTQVLASLAERGAGAPPPTGG